MRLTRSIFVILLPATLIFAQSQPSDQMKLTQPGEHHKQLEPLAGDWDVTLKFRYGSGPERQAKATSTAKWILGGRFLERVYRSGGPEFLEYLGYDNQRNRFVGAKMDNMDTGILSTEGDMSADGKILTMKGVRTDPLTGASSNLRIVTTITDQNHFSVEWFQSDKDGKESRVLLMDHTRRGGSTQ